MIAIAVAALVIAVAAFVVAAVVYRHAIGRRVIVFQHGCIMSDRSGRKYKVFRAEPWNIPAWISYYRLKHRGTVNVTWGSFVIKLRVVYEHED